MVKHNLHILDGKPTYLIMSHCTLVQSVSKILSP